MMNEQQPSGWVKPVRQRTLAELKSLIAETEANLAVLRQEAFDLEEGVRLEAIARIRNIMRAREISIDDLV